MKWISSEGGPLILMGKKSLANWLGIEGDDYERACSIDDYSGTLNVAGSQALVFGDEPCQTAVHRSENLGMLIVRWQWAESESSVQQFLNSLTSDVFKNPEEVIEYRIDDNVLLLFDSVESGEKATGLTLNQPRATYLVTTVCYTPDDNTSLILHRFSQKSD